MVKADAIADKSNAATDTMAVEAEVHVDVKKTGIACLFFLSLRKLRELRQTRRIDRFRIRAQAVFCNGRVASKRGDAIAIVFKLSRGNPHVATPARLGRDMSDQ